MNNTDNNIEIQRIGNWNTLSEKLFHCEEDTHPGSTQHVQETMNRCLLVAEWMYACMGEHECALEVAETLSVIFPNT